MRGAGNYRNGGFENNKKTFMNVMVTGYPYARQNYRDFFEKSGAYFVLPKVWKIKGGKTMYRTNPSNQIVVTSAFFHHSHYPIIGGLLKGWMPLAPFYMWKIKRKHGAKIVFDAVEPYLLTSLFNAFFAKLLGLKYIAFSWQNVKIPHRFVLFLNFLFIDAVVCGNQKCLKIFQKITKKPLAQIPLAGLDCEKFKLKANRPKKEKTVFLFVGALDYRKGVHVLLEAFKKIIDAELIVVGSGTYEDEIKSQIKVIPWADHETIIGLLAAADIFVYPSISYGGWEEQFGYSMAEASLMELPIITTRTGSIEEVVIDGKTGLLVSPDNPNEFSLAMAKLAGDPILRDTMGKAGREFILKNFNNKTITGAYDSFFNSLS